MNTIASECSCCGATTFIHSDRFQQEVERVRCEMQQQVQQQVQHHVQHQAFHDTYIHVQQAIQSTAAQWAHVVSVKQAQIDALLKAAQQGEEEAEAQEGGGYHHQEEAEGHKEEAPGEEEAQEAPVGKVAWVAGAPPPKSKGTTTATGTLTSTSSSQTTTSTTTSTGSQTTTIRQRAPWRVWARVLLQKDALRETVEVATQQVVKAKQQTKQQAKQQAKQQRAAEELQEQKALFDAYRTSQEEAKVRRRNEQAMITNCITAVITELGHQHVRQVLLHKLIDMGPAMHAFVVEAKTKTGDEKMTAVVRDLAGKIVKSKFTVYAGKKKPDRLFVDIAEEAAALYLTHPLYKGNLKLNDMKI